MFQPLKFRTVTSSKRLYVLSSLWGWGFPALFVALTAAIKDSAYERHDDQYLFFIFKPEFIVYGISLDYDILYKAFAVDLK